jgi:hypothetical protein
VGIPLYEVCAASHRRQRRLRFKWDRRGLMPSLSHSVGVKKNRQQISGKLISQ